MANVDLLIETHSAQLEREFEINGIWAQLFRDRTGEMGDGTTLSLPSDDTVHADVEVTQAIAYGTTAADLAWGAPTIMTSGDVSLTVTNPYKFYEAVGDIVRQTIRPDLLAESARQHGRLYANKISAACRAELVTEAALNTPKFGGIVTYSVATGDWGGNAHRTAVLDMLDGLKEEMDADGAPTLGRVVVVNLETDSVIRKAMRAGNIHFQAPINDRLVILGEFPMYGGFSIVPDPVTPRGHTAAQDVRQDMFAFVAGEGGSLARRIGLTPEIFRDRVYMTMSIQGSYLYAVSMHQASKFYHGNVTIT